jgi:paraquat-inducible protein A
LRRGRPRGAAFALPLALAALPLLPLAFLTPLIHLSLLGRGISAALTTGPALLDAEGWLPLAAVVLLTACLLPGLRLLGLTVVLLGLRRAHPRRRLLRPLFRATEHLRPWAMVEVYLLGFFVAYSKLIDLARVHVELAGYALAALMLVMALIDEVLDPTRLWEQMAPPASAAPPPEIAQAGASQSSARGLIGCLCCGLLCEGAPGAPCPRCGSRLHARKRQSFWRSLALVLAAVLLYIPANLLPIMTVDYYGQGIPNTILSGVEELAASGMWPLAILVFFASITVPVLKLLGLGVLLASTRGGATRRLLDRARLYRLIDAIGRWSMIDVFMLSILVGVVQLGLLATVTPGAGAVAFAGVVILTMLASQSFDPRLMWDAAGRQGQRQGRRRGQP